MIKGPSRGRPLQLQLTESDGEERGQPQANAIDNMVKASNPEPLKRS